MNDVFRRDSALFRGMTQRRLDRRHAMRLAGLSAAGLALTACGVPGKGVAPPTSSAQARSEVDAYWSGKKPNGHVAFANWPLYMDPERPQLRLFTERTGITVTYKEVIQDMASWFAKIQPQLAAGQSIGYDLMIITNGIQLDQLVQLGYLVPLDHSKLPTFAANVEARYRNETFDKGNVYSIPWASGMTGIAYNPKYVDTPPTSVSALFDPKYKGKVGMLSDSQEIANVGLFALGIDPATSTPADWEKAAAKLREQRDAGIVRKYYDQSYVGPLSKGELWITMAWSGDIFQQNVSDGTDLRFVIPDEGGTIWTDNMVIPKTATNPVDAIMLMDFFYDLEVAASLTEYITYVSPVPGARTVIEADIAKASGEEKKLLQTIASSPTVFPTPADYAKLRTFVEFGDSRQQKLFNDLFQAITTS